MVAQSEQDAASGVRTDTGAAVPPVKIPTPAPGTQPVTPTTTAAATPGLTNTATPDTAALVPPPVPSSGSTPTTGFAAPAAIPPVPIGTAPAFSPTSNSVGSVIAPSTDPRLAGMNGAVDTSLAGIQSTPDRYALAQQEYGTYADQTDPAYSKSLTDAEKMASATGTNGSGMLNTSFGNLALARGRDLQAERDTLFNNAQQSTMADRQATLAALLGAQGQTAAQDASDRGEQRTERQYQADAGNTALSQAEQEALVNDELTNSQFGRSATQTQLGYENDPSMAQLTAAGQQGQQVSAANAGTSSLMQLLAASGNQPNWQAIIKSMTPQAAG